MGVMTVIVSPSATWVTVPSSVRWGCGAAGEVPGNGALGRGAADVARGDPAGAPIRQGEFQPLAIFGDVDHARSGTVRDALEVIRATGFLVERNAGLMRGLEFHLVADRGGEGDADREEKGEGQKERSDD